MKSLLYNNTIETLVVIPSFNELKLQSVVDEVLSKGFHVLVVDDGSSALALERHQALYIARHKVNLGQGAALQTGLEIARALNPSYVVTMDADGQHRAEDLPRFLAEIKAQQVDIIFGKRTFGKDIPLIRRAMIRLGILFNWFYTGIKLKDAHNGYRILNKNAYTKINLREPEMAHATEILEHVKSQNLSYSECDVKILYTAYSLGKGQRNSNAFSIIKHLIFRRL